MFLLLKGAPKPVAMEPCSGGKAAVLTVLIRLPSGPSGLPPPGQSGKTLTLFFYLRLFLFCDHIKTKM